MAQPSKHKALSSNPSTIKKKKKKIKKPNSSQVPVAHICNPRNQEDQSSKPAWGNSSQDPISKYPSQNRASGVHLSSSPSTAKKKKKKEIQNS
jgi:hypothetical protein